MLSRIHEVPAPIGAIAVRPSLDEVREKVALGHMQAWRVSGQAEGFAITTTALVRGSHVPALWITYVVGKVTTGRRGMEALGREFEAIARGWGCREMRVEGERAEQWLRVLPGFEIVERRGPEAVLRKVL